MTNSMSSACHSRAAFGTAAPQGKQRGTPLSAFIPNRYQAAFEAGVFFVLCEGLLRRLLPGAGAYILSFKFAYFPLVYCYLIAVLPHSPDAVACPRRGGFPGLGHVDHRRPSMVVFGRGTGWVISQHGFRARRLLCRPAVSRQG